MRSSHRLALFLGLSLTAGACLDKRPAATDGGAASSSSSGPAAAATDPDVESLQKSKAGGWKDFFTLSPEDNQSDDPSLSIKLVRIAKLRHDRIGIVLAFENRREAPFDNTNATGTLLDAEDRSMPVLAKPAGFVAPDATQNLVWIFDVKDAAKGSFEMRIDVPGTKTWPVVFSKDKPPDFKPTPNAGEQGPQGPGPMGPSGY